MVSRKEYRLATTQSGRFAQFLRTEYNRFGMLFYMRERRRATQSDFAAHLHVSEAVLQSWLDETARPTRDDLLRLPHELVATAHEILNGWSL